MNRNFFTFLAAFSLFLGVMIFTFVHSGALRYYGGDVVAIIFLYSVIMATLRPRAIIAAITACVIAIGIEVLQAFVTLPRTEFISLTLGSTFDPLDIIIYIISASLLVVATQYTEKNSSSFL